MSKKTAQIKAAFGGKEREKKRKLYGRETEKRNGLRPFVRMYIESALSVEAVLPMLETIHLNDTNLLLVVMFAFVRCASTSPT